MVEFFHVLGTTLGQRVRTLVAQVRGLGRDGSDALSVPGANAGAATVAEPGDDVEVVQPLGLTARPARTRTLEAVVVRDGDEVVVLALVDKGLPTLSGLEEGETRLHGAAAGNVAACVRIKVNGDIEITPAEGRNVVLAGGASPAAHEGSATTGHTHPAGALVAGPYAVTGATASATDTIATGQGSARVLVPGS